MNLKVTCRIHAKTIFDGSNLVFTIAGKYKQDLVSSDGIGEAARFIAPRGIACGQDGALYVVEDMPNSSIRKLISTGDQNVYQVSTIPGTQGNSIILSVLL